MRCFRHAQSEAVGTCKQCFKGVCADCAIDTGIGLACSPACQEEIKSIKALVDRNKQAFPIAAKAHIRNGVLLLLFSVAFFAFGWGEQGSLFIFLASFGAIMVVGAVFSFLLARKYGRANR